MDFVTELKPIQMGRDQFQVIVTPFIISFLYFALLFLQTLIKERDDEDPMGFAYFFKVFSLNLFSPFFPISPSLGPFIVIFLSFWVSIRTINQNGNLGNVSISSFILGIGYFLLDSVFFISFVNESNKNNDEFVLSEYIRDNIEFLSASLIFSTVEFVIISIIFGGVYFELTKNSPKKKDMELYPNS